MRCELFNISNVKLQAAVIDGNDVIGFFTAVQEVDNPQGTNDYFGMADLFRQPLKNILTTKQHYDLSIVNGKPIIKMPNGAVMDKKFFEDYQRRTGKPSYMDIKTASPELKAYFEKQTELFASLTHVSPEPTPRITQVPQPTQPTPAPQPVVQPVVQPVQAAPVNPNRPRETFRGQIFSCDGNFTVGQTGIYSTISPTQQLPPYSGTNAAGQHVYGNEKLTEEECLAVIQIPNLISDTGLHLLTAQEVDYMNSEDGVLSGSNPQCQQIVMALLGVQATLNKEIHKVRRAERNIITLRDGLQASLNDYNIPYELGSQRFSFKYMSFIDEKGNPITDTANPLLLARVKEDEMNGTQVVSQREVKQAAAAQPRPLVTPQPAPQQPKPNPFNVQPFAGTQTPKAPKSYTATAYVRKFLSTDGKTIEGVILEVEGVMEGVMSNGERRVKSISGTMMNSLERIHASLPRFLKSVDVKNAKFEVVDGKLEVIMEPTQLNQIDVIPENRFVHPSEFDYPRLFRNDKALEQMIETPKFERTVKTVVHTNAEPYAPVEAVTHTPANTAQPQNKVTPNISAFIEFLKRQQGNLHIVGMAGTDLQTINVNVDELKAYLNI